MVVEVPGEQFAWGCLEECLQSRPPSEPQKGPACPPAPQSWDPGGSFGRPAPASALAGSGSAGHAAPEGRLNVGLLQLEGQQLLEVSGGLLGAQGVEQQGFSQLEGPRLVEQHEIAPQQVFVGCLEVGFGYFLRVAWSVVGCLEISVGQLAGNSIPVELLVVLIEEQEETSQESTGPVSRPSGE